MPPAPRKPSESKLGRPSAVTLLGLALVLSAPALTAEARELHLERFDARINVAPSGAIEVTETVHARFVGSWQGLYRTIPVEYRTPAGLNFTLDLDVVSVTDERGAPLVVETSREGAFRKLKIFVPGAEDTSKTIVATYRVSNALRFAPDQDELYWNVTGDRWDVPIERAAASIMLPAGVTGLRATAFTGAFGARASDADVQVESPRVDVRMQKALGLGEGLTVSVTWDKGFVHGPTWDEKLVGFLRSNWPLGFPLAALMIMTGLWLGRGRGRRLRPVTVRHNPPEGMSPAEAGALFDDQVDIRDVTATIVDLALRGFLLIEHNDAPRTLSRFSGAEYQLQLRRKESEWTSLLPHERLLLGALFSGANIVKASRLPPLFRDSLPHFKNEIFDKLVRAGCYTASPEHTRKRTRVAAGISGGLVAAAGPVAAIALGVSLLPFLIAGVLTAVIIWRFGRTLAVPTDSGKRVLEELHGFREFLRQVEGHRLERTLHTPEMFEAFLPFAIALRVEGSWVRAFGSIYPRSGHWLRSRGTDEFYPHEFPDNLDRISGQARLTPGSGSSSGDSDSGGGGGSGGGYGGGGGGGF